MLSRRRDGPRAEWVAIGMLAGAVVLLLFHGNGAGNVVGVPLAQEMHGKEEYVVVVDAGSSGTRTHVYRIDAAGGLIDHVDVERVQPGLATFALVPQSGASHVAQSVDRVLTRNTLGISNRVAFYLFGTAGMRALEPYDADQLLAAVVKRLRLDSRVSIQANHVQVISGEMEGVYGWLALNAHLGRTGLSCIEENQRYNLIEMGGASMQLVVESIDPDYTIAMEGCPPVGVRVSSCHGCGGQSAFSYYTAFLAASEGLTDPCRSQIDNQTSADTFESCLDAVRDAALPLPQCIDSKHTRCLFDDLEAMTLSSLVGISEIYWVAHDLYTLYSSVPLPDGIQDITAKKLRVLASLACDFGDSNTAAGRLCFRAAWVYATLYERLGLPHDHILHVVGGDAHHQVSWPLGALLVHRFGAVLQ